MAETKRGFSLKDYEALEENKILAPYPSWDGWKHVLFKHLKEKGYREELPDEVQEIMHEWYLFRRLYQLGEKTREEYDVYRVDFLKEHVELLDKRPDMVLGIKFISDKTLPGV